MLFCDQCGGGNETTASACQFCQQPLSRLQLDSEEASLSTSSQGRGQQLITIIPVVPLEPGVLFKGRYQIVEVLGEGGYGSTYKAEDAKLKGMTVAIKMIDLAGLSTSQTRDAIATFEREAFMLRLLSHTGIPRLHSHFNEGSRRFLVMEYVEGRTLEDYLESLYPTHFEMTMVVRSLLEVILEICDILVYLHHRNPPVIYRDLKPSNIIIGPYNKVSLIDFGIARSYREGQYKDTIPFGSPGYAAPEQYGKAQTTTQSDIYSLGALLHQVLTGLDPASHPFRFPPIPEKHFGMSRELPGLVSRMLELEPQRRPHSIIEVRQNIELALHTYPADRVEIYIPPQKKSRRGASIGVSRRRVLALGGGLLAASCIGIFASALNHRQSVAVSSYSTIQEDTPTPSSVHKLVPAWQHTFNSSIKCIARGNDVAGSAVSCMDKSLSVLSENGRVVDMGHEYPTDHMICVPFSDLVASWQHQSQEVVLWSRTDNDPYYGHFSVPASIVALAGARDHIAVVCEDQNVYITEYRRLAESGWATVTSSVQVGSSVRDLTLVVDPYDSVYFVVGYAYGFVAVYTNGRQTLSYMHKAMVNEVSCSPDLYNIASASDDGTVIVSGLQDPTLHITYRGHTNVGGKVRHVAWLDDTKVASLDDLGNLHIWSIAALDHAATIDKPEVAQTAVVDATLSAWGSDEDQLYLAFAKDKQTFAAYSVTLG